MSSKPSLIAAAALTLFGTSLYAVPVLAPDGDFSSPDSVDLWGTGGEDNTTFSYPDAGGNPGGYGVMDNNGMGFGVFVAADGEVFIDDIGLVPGLRYNFIQDMILLEGDNIGGLKIEFYRLGAIVFNTGDMFIPAVGDGRAWATYSYPVTVPANADAIKFVPLWGPGSTVGYDNIGFDDEAVVPPTIPPLPNEGFETAGGASWVFDQQGSGADPHTVTFPAEGGNPGGHAVIDASSGTGFAQLFANENSFIPYENFGVPSGSTVRFTVDMKLFSGTEIGKFKIEYAFAGGGFGGSGDLLANPVGGEIDPSQWNTYTFDVPIPDFVDQIKVVPLWGAGSVVGYDNVRFDDSVVVPPSNVAVKNPGFETPDGDSWIFFQAGSLGLPHSVTYPIEGGNPGGYAVIDASGGGGFAGLVSNGGTFLPIERFGILADSDVLFAMDMKLFGGENIGNLKIEYIFDDGTLGNTGDLFPDQLNIASGWATYTFEVYIPEGVAGIKIVPLWGLGSVVGFDNIGLFSPKEFTLSISSGTLVRWSPEGATATYQPQESTDGISYIDLGPPFSGTETNSVFDPSPAPFYRVQESIDGAAFSTVDSTDSGAVQLSYPTEPGFSYQLQSSENLATFADDGPPTTGTGQVQSTTEPAVAGARFYKVLKLE